ncbi:MAG: hypothetical protein HUU06_07505 [Planctomycetaceae bacterium]|nr:hypothetical protein [Planctomycetaceae bacterium]
MLEVGAVVVVLGVAAASWLLRSGDPGLGPSLDAAIAREAARLSLPDDPASPDASVLVGQVLDRVRFPDFDEAGAEAIEAIHAMLSGRTPGVESLPGASAVLDGRLLESNAPALALLEEAVALPRWRLPGERDLAAAVAAFRERPEEGFLESPLAGIPLMEVTGLVVLRGLRERDRGNLGGAVEQVRLLLRLQDRMKGNPSGAGWAVRVSADATRLAARILEAPGLDEPAARALLDAFTLPSEEAAAAVRRQDLSALGVLARWRLFLDVDPSDGIERRMMDSLPKSLRWTPVLAAGPEEKNAVTRGYPPYWDLWEPCRKATAADLAKVMARLAEFRRLAGLPSAGAFSGYEALEREAMPVPRGWNRPGDLPFTDSYEFEGRALRESWLAVGRLGCAVRLHEIRTGSFPGTLEELVPGCLPSLPLDPLTGGTPKWLVHRGVGHVRTRTSPSRLPGGGDDGGTLYPWLELRPRTAPTPESDR